MLGTAPCSTSKQANRKDGSTQASSSAQSKALTPPGARGGAKRTLSEVGGALPVPASGLLRPRAGLFWRGLGATAQAVARKRQIDLSVVRLPPVSRVGGGDSDVVLPPVSPATPVVGSEEFFKIWEVYSTLGGMGNRWVEGLAEETFSSDELQQLRWESLRKALGDATGTSLKPRLGVWKRWVELQTQKGDSAFKCSPARLVQYLIAQVARGPTVAAGQLRGLMWWESKVGASVPVFHSSVVSF